MPADAPTGGAPTALIAPATANPGPASGAAPQGGISPAGNAPGAAGTPGAPVPPTAGADPNPAADPNATPEVWTPSEAELARPVKLVIDGVEQTMPMGKVMSLARMGIGANRRMQEVAQQRREMDQQTAQLREVFNDPARFFHELRRESPDGSFPWMQRLFAEVERYSKMSDAERRNLDYEHGEAERQRSATEADRQRREQAFSATMARVAKDAGIPAGPIGELVTSRMMQVLQQARREGKRVTQPQLTEWAKRQVQQLRRDVAPPAAAAPAAPAGAPLIPGVPPAAPPTRHSVRDDEGRFSTRRGTYVPGNLASWKKSIGL